MPPRKRAVSKKAALFADVAKFLQQVSPETEIPTVDLDSIEDRDYRSTDGIVLFAHYPANFKPGCCAECGAKYVVNRNAVGFCSDPCRRENWQKTTGVPWRAVSTNDVWDGNPPNIITADQIKKLAAIAEWFNTNRTVLDTLVEKESEPEEFELFESSLEDSQSDLEDLLKDQSRVLSREAFLESVGWEQESDQQNIPPTSPQPEPSHEGLELTEEEVSLFGFL